MLNFTNMWLVQETELIFIMFIFRKREENEQLTLKYGFLCPGALSTARYVYYISLSENNSVELSRSTLFTTVGVYETATMSLSVAASSSSYFANSSIKSQYIHNVISQDNL